MLTTGSWPSSARSSRTMSTPRNRSVRRPWSTGTTWASPRRPCATTWPRWRRRATSPSRTPAPAGSPPTRVPPVRRPADHGQADVERRAPRHLRVPGRCDRPGRRGAPHGAPARDHRQVAVVQYPTLTRSTVRNVELVTLSFSRLLVVLITSTGRVEQRVVDVGATVADEFLRDVRARLNAAVAGRPLTEAATAVADLPETFKASVHRRSPRSCRRPGDRRRAHRGPDRGERYGQPHPVRR